MTFLHNLLDFMILLIILLCLVGGLILTLPLYAIQWGIEALQTS